MAPSSLVTVSFSQSSALFLNTRRTNDQKQPEKPSPVQRGGPTNLRDGTPTLRFRHILGPQSIENARQGKYFAFFIISLLKFVFTFLSFYNILQQQGKIILILK